MEDNEKTAAIRTLRGCVQAAGMYGAALMLGYLTGDTIRPFAAMLAVDLARVAVMNTFSRWLCVGSIEAEDYQHNRLGKACFYAFYAASIAATIAVAAKAL